MESLKKYDEKSINDLNPLALAFVGDSIFSLYIREHVVANHQTNVNNLTKLANSFVNAGSQYKIFRKIEPLLTADEINICHRARNANIHSKAKNYSITEYIYATAYEALLGYLYLTGQKDRLNKILTLSVESL